MSRYDELKNNIQALYDAAQAELLELEKKRQEVLKDIENLSKFVGNKKTYSLETLKVTSSKSTRSRKAAPRAAAAPAAAKKPAKAAKQPVVAKKSRIKEETIRQLVCKYLKDAEPNSMSPVEIFGRLLKEGMPDTQSFRTRVYGKLGIWANEGVIKKVGRGVYKSAK